MRKYPSLLPPSNSNLSYFPLPPSFSSLLLSLPLSFFSFNLSPLPSFSSRVFNRNSVTTYLREISRDFDYLKPSSSHSPSISSFLLFPLLLYHPSFSPLLNVLCSSLLATPLYIHPPAHLCSSSVSSQSFSSFSLLLSLVSQSPILLSIVPQPPLFFPPAHYPLDFSILLISPSFPPPFHPFFYLWRIC